MTEQEEHIYTRGQRQAYTYILTRCLHYLGYNTDDPLVMLGHLVAEREETIAALRSACEEIGDNKWDEKLHLADIINKHLVCYIESEDE